MRRLLLIPALFAGCADDTFLVVTVAKRDAVHDAATLKVNLDNAGQTRGDSLDVGSAMFPLTFSITTTGRTGPLAITIDAFDKDKNLVGHGAGATTLDQQTAQVELDSADFVVNTIPAGNQFLSNDFEANGLQLAATAAGTWTVGFRDECTNCEMYARRFDATGLPVDSTIAAGKDQFPVTTTQTASGAIAAVAAANTTTLVLWDYLDTVGAPAATGVACRALDTMGNATPGQLAVTNTTTESPDVVTATGLNNGNFAVTWQSFMTMQVVRRTIVKPDCTALTPAPLTISSGATNAHRSHVTSNADKVLYAWIVSGDVHVRIGANDGSFAATGGGPEATLLTRTASLDIDHVRVAPMGSGFAVVVRWAAPSGTGPGKIELYRVSNTSTLMGGPTLITSDSESDFASDKAFGIATGTNGATLIVWHNCPSGLGSCDVYGRVVRPTGVPVGDPFVLATATNGDQTGPSVVALPGGFAAAWTDASGTEPDHAGSAVRARVLYPPYDNAASVIGAPCGGALPACGTGLACAMGSDGMQRCFATCTPPSCPGGGTCTTVDATTSACTF